MGTSSTTITLKDERTGRIYAMQVYDENKRDYSIGKLKEKMDYEYFESLPAEERINQKVISLDFTCPFCIEKTEVSSRKEKIISGFLFFIRTDIIDIFKCQKCQNEFTNEKLKYKKDEIRRKNNVINNFENWKDAKRDGKNPPGFMSLDKIDEVIISFIN